MASIQAVAFPSGAPAPYVDLLITGPAPVGAATVTVSRTSEGRTFKVRGMVDLDVNSELTRRDYEAPFDREMTYLAQYFDGGGNAVGYSEQASVRLPALTRGTAWWHNPLDPESAVRVMMGPNAASELTREIESELLRVRNRSVGVMIGGVRQGLTKIPLDCITLTPGESARFDALFGGYDRIVTGVVCIRPSGVIPLPGVLFANVSAPTQQPYNRKQRVDPSSDWPLVGDEVAPPAPAIVRALLTYQDFEDFYSSYAEFEAAYPSYQEASRDY
ncbi:hypothetical protein [Herbiconiux sp. UC225_62]|uniref:hypothetical protein n=1 Tax=Herbiconiux sp. UC225_62 TaxID=3350168 RepID=UPI0036D42466